MRDEAPSPDLQTGDQALLWEPGQPLPVFATLDGVAVALLSLEEYKELAACRAKLAFADVVPKRKASGRPAIGLSTIERDAEVAAWLRDRFHGGITAAALHADCLAAFGAARTPSLSRISRFRLRVRRAR